MIFYSQRDPKWMKEKLGSGPDTIGQSGCKLSSFCNLGKDMEWFDYTPQALNKLMIKEKLYTSGLLIADSVIAKHFGLSYEKSLKDPGTICIAETNYYKNKGVPQHFFLYEKGMAVDPLAPFPAWKKNVYPIVSYRVFKKRAIEEPQKPVVISVYMPPTSTTLNPVPSESSSTSTYIPPKASETVVYSVPAPEVIPTYKKTIFVLIIEDLVEWFKKIIKK